MKYPIGIQTFSEIINDNYVYVDKTDILYKLVKGNKYVFLGRPRRFGKSLLSSTLKSYFKAEKNLFKGLLIDKLENEWKEYPVLYFDFSTAKNQDIQGIKNELYRQLNDYEEKYGYSDMEISPGQKLAGLIKRANETKGERTVVIIDEYDAAMLDHLHNENNHNHVLTMMQEFFAPLKSCDAHLRFVFLTGITKFAQMNIFSVVNNINNVSMDPEYEAICGITENELHSVFAKDIERLAEEYKCSVEDMKLMLKQYYDGYRFGRGNKEIYNPYSILNAFQKLHIDSYWFASGTPTYLIHQLQRYNTDVTSIDNVQTDASSFDRPTTTMTNALPLLYQSGYLTIKDYNRETNSFCLGIPNKEVRIGLAENLLPVYTKTTDLEDNGLILNLFNALRNDDIEDFFSILRSYLAGIPYSDKEIVKRESYYETILYLIFSFMNRYVQTQVRSCRGRADIVMQYIDTIYVIEIKVDKSADEALKQIDDKGYMIPYESSGKRLIKCGVSFSTLTRTLQDWKVE